MRTSGFIYRLQNTYARKSPIKDEKNDVVSVNFEHIYVIFYTYLVGVAASVLIMVFEFVIHKCVV